MSTSPEATFTEALLGPWVRTLERTRSFLNEGPLRPPPPPHRWSMPHTIALETGAMRLRDFSLPGSEGEAPFIVVAPEVNGSHVADYAPDQSLLRCLRDLGARRLYLVCWRSATEATAELGIDDSVAAVRDAVDAVGGRAHLVGLCQGGWESAVLAALEPDRVLSLTLAAAPIDFHAGGGLMRWWCSVTPRLAYEAMVGLGGGVMRGDVLRLGFDGLRPVERGPVKWAALWARLDDPAFVERLNHFEGWYGARKDLPGRMYLEAVERLFGRNELIRGELEVLGRRVDLGAVRCPVALLAGTRDHITPPPQVWAAEAAVGSDRVERFEVDAGHVGVFIGHEAQRVTWPAVMAFLQQP